MFTELWTWIRHNQALVIGLIVCAAVLIWGLACDPITQSPFEMNKKVTRAQLDIAIQDYANKIALAYEDLKRQEEIRDTILNAGLAYAQGSGIDPLGLVLTIAGILGIGVAVDNRRKDAVITSKTNALNKFVNAKEGNT